MLIWAAVIIPIVAILVLAAKFNSKMTWWEYALVFSTSFACIGISKFTAETSLTNDVEYWNSYGIQATYYEHWNEYIHKTCETCTESCSGSGDDRSCTTTCIPYDCSYVEDHPAHWDLTDNMGQSFSISSQKFNGLVMSWENKTFKKMYRSCHSICGDAYYTNYNNDTSKIVSIVTKHTYENRVQASNSVFNFPDVDTATISKYSLYEYPDNFDRYNFSYLLGENSPKANRMLQYYNVEYGKSRKLHMLVLVFKDKPLQAAMAQEAYWKGGNKNEFILCVGVNTSNNTIDWAKVITWSDDKRLKVDVEADVSEMQKYNIVKIVDYLGNTVCKRFQKKSFKDFSYITVEPSNTAVAITFIVTLLVTVGVSFFCIRNDVDRDDHNRFGRRY